MQRSKSYAILFLVIAFIAGTALGYTVERVAAGRHPHDERPSRDRVARELNLTAAQRIQFDSIMNARRLQMRELFKPIQPQLDSLQKIAHAMADTTHEQLKKILTPEQGRKLDEMRERARKRAADRAHESERNKPGR